MIRIKKGREPGKLLWYRQQDGASYEQMDKEVREELIDQLLREQGHLCAYCMSKIPESRNLPSGVPAVTIEHWLPRNPDDKLNIGQVWTIKICLQSVPEIEDAGAKKN